MDQIAWLIDFVLHVDEHLDQILKDYGTWTYGILMLVVFCETGLVLTPILPGDSLLFAAGMFAGRGALDPVWLHVLIALAAIAGDNTNYWVGRYLGPKVLKNEDSRIFMARFVPIVRTFAPFVAGVGAMSYPRYLAYSVGGAVLWVGICVYSGFFLGNIPMIRDHFEIAVLLIIAVSVMPMVIEYLRHRGGGAAS